MATAVVKQIVEALDGVTLAIELAATRMAVTLRGAAARASINSFDVLDAHGAGRHASMRRTVLDSVELLARDDARAFAACAAYSETVSPSKPPRQC